MPGNAYDLAGLRTRFTIRQLLARKHGPDLDPVDTAGAGQYLDELEDGVLNVVLAGTGRTPAWGRKQLASWRR
jgi:hypothetical protein